MVPGIAVVMHVAAAASANTVDRSYWPLASSLDHRVFVTT